MFSRRTKASPWILVLTFSVITAAQYSHSDNKANTLQTEQRLETDLSTDTLNPPSPRLGEESKEVSVEDIPNYDLLALDDNIKSLLDREVKHIRGRKERFNRLHEVLYEPYYYNMRYFPQKTHTAIDTFYAGGGNCVSLSNLFVAAARYVGLRAYYQSVRVDRQWHKQDGFFEVPGHMNVMVKLGRERAVVEFNQAFMDQYSGHKMVQKVISDEQAKAEFYNNLGVKALGEKQISTAIAYFQKGVKLHKESDFIWSNMGVAYRHAGEYEEAETRYLTALKFNSRNKSTIGNLFVLYREWGDAEKRQLYANAAEKYARRNPYYLADKAKEHIEAKQFDKATKLLKTAIRIQKIEPDFHHQLAIAYYHLGKDKKSKTSLAQAQKLAATHEDKRRYQSKIDSLAIH